MYREERMGTEAMNKAIGVNKLRWGKNKEAYIPVPFFPTHLTRLF
jgi:hypothetical protein